MELSWLTKLKISAAALVGILLIGLLAWPLVQPIEPTAAVSAGTVNFSDALILISLAFVIGLVTFFIAKPYGKEIAVIAVPAGLAIWALRTGSIAQMMIIYPTAQLRSRLFKDLMFEPLFWLLLVAAGFAGTYTASRLICKKTTDQSEKPEAKSSPGQYLNPAIALVCSIVIIWFGIKLFAQQVTANDHQLGTVIAQPSKLQIALAVMLSFGMAAFVAKLFLKTTYIWTILAAAFVTAICINIYSNPEFLANLASRWPAVFFPNPILAILPLQMVSFGTLGAIAGYWLAIRYRYWRHYIA